MAGDEYLGIELSNRLQRTNGAVLVMRKVGRQQARSDTVERGMGGDQCVAGDQHHDVRQEEAGVPAWALSAPLGSLPLQFCWARKS